MFKTTMKNSLKYIAILSIAGASIATAAETAGFGISSTLGYQLPLVTFIASLILMTFIADYRRLAVHGFEPRLSKAILTPANEAFAQTTAAPVAATSRRIRRVRHQLVRS
jgi:hypothetical protein